MRAHPMPARFPVGLFPASGLSMLLYLTTGSASFEFASYYTLILGALGAIAALFTGLYDWKVHYERSEATFFSEKKVLSIVVVVLSLYLIGIRTLDSEKLFTEPFLKWGYILLLWLLTPLTLFLAYLGDQWPSAEFGLLWVGGRRGTRTRTLRLQMNLTTIALSWEKVRTQFYLDAAQRADEEEAQGMFRELAAQEEEHAERMRQRLSEIRGELQRERRS